MLSVILRHSEMQGSDSESQAVKGLLHVMDTSGIKFFKAYFPLQEGKADLTVRKQEVRRLKCFGHYIYNNYFPDDGETGRKDFGDRSFYNNKKKH